MSDSFSRLTLWFAALVFGAHIGAAVYEVIVVTPLWADTDAQIIEHVHAWILWSRLRLIALLLAWIATVASLLRRSAPRRTLFRSDVRWK
jgi:hypothetical protein